MLHRNALRAKGVQLRTGDAPGGSMCLAIPAKVIETGVGEPTRALVEVVGVRRHIDTGLLVDDPPRPDDWVLVHVGFAMSKISEQQALDQLNTLALLGEQQAAFEEAQGYGNSDSAFDDTGPPGLAAARERP